MALRSRARECAPIAAITCVAGLLGACEAYNRDWYRSLVDGSTNTDIVQPPDGGVDAGDTVVDVPLIDRFDPLDVTDVVVPGDVPPPTDNPIPPIDSGRDDTACDDTHAGALFCDGFEEPGLPAWSSFVSPTASRATTGAYRGAGALRTETTASGGSSVAAANVFAHLTTGDLYVRGYYYFPSGYDISGMYVLMAIATSGDNTGMGVVAGSHVNAYTMPGMHYLSGASSVTFARDRWVCLEMHIALSTTATGTIELSVDGATAASETGFATAPTEGYTNLYVGIPYAEPTQGPAIVYVDEVVADTRPIGCD